MRRAHTPLARTRPRTRQHPAGQVDRVMRTVAESIASLEIPAVEKIATEQAGDPFRVLIATMLSAQTRDPVTLAASMRLFARAATPQAAARLGVREIERLIYPVSFYRHKARHVREASALILSRFGGRVPASLPDLLSLPGVGRKTANLVLIVAHRRRHHICVDTHVHRIANRLGWVRTRTPEQTEAALYEIVPRRWWSRVNLCFVTWGQNVCRPVAPRCGQCAISTSCPRVGVSRVARFVHPGR